MANAVRALDARVRVKQFYEIYLDSMYYVDYYQEVSHSLGAATRRLDLIVSVATGLGTGSSLGVLGSPAMAYPTAIITGASFLISVWNSVYKWPENNKFCTDMVQNYSSVFGQCKIMFQDLQASKVWDEKCESSFNDLRKKISNFPVSRLKSLPVPKQRNIQQAIVARENPQAWWAPTAAAAAEPQPAATT